MCLYKLGVFLYCLLVYSMHIFVVREGYGNAGMQPEQYAACQANFFRLCGFSGKSLDTPVALTVQLVEVIN